MIRSLVSASCPLVGEQMVPGSSTQRGKIGRSIVPLGLLNLFVLVVFPSPSHARRGTQEQQKRALGSLTSVGEVYVNDTAAPVESTIFRGDTLRTGEAGSATFTVSGKGMLKISPRSEVVFAGDYQFTAELKDGTVVLSSISGPSGITLRVENFVLVSSIRQQSATTKIERGANGSFLVSCLDGSVGVLTIEGKSGQFLPEGHSLTISSGQVIAPVSSETHTAGHNFHSGWLLLGLGGAGAAGLVAGFGHGGKLPVSPSGP